MTLDESGQFSRAWPFVTTLPASPVDGQVVLYLADSGAGVVWPLRYRAASGNADKWEYIGSGTPLFAAVETNDSFAPSGANAWVNGGTPGPDVIVPLAGVYEARWGAQSNPAADGQQQQIGLSIGSGNDPGSNAVAVNGNINSVSVTRAFRTGSIAASTRLRVMYRDAAGSGTSAFSKRWLSVVPVRVSG